MTCTKISMRAENLSVEVKRNRSNYSRKYKAKRRRAIGVPSRVTYTFFDAKKFYEWVSKFITEEEFTFNNGTRKDAVGVRYLLNGIVIDKSDGSLLRKFKRGAVERIPLSTVDRICSRYDLLLWEAAEAASCYKKDTRSMSRDQLIGRLNAKA
jgi:hypothetical protein